MRVRKILSHCKPIIAGIVVCIMTFYCSAFVFKPMTAEAFLDGVIDAAGDLLDGAKDVVVDVVEGGLDWITDDGYSEVKEAAKTALGISSSDDDTETYSLYDISCLLGKYMNDATKPSEKDGTPKGIKVLDDADLGSIGELDVGDAGAFVAYAEKGWLASLLSSSSTTYAYESFNNVAVSSASSTETSVIYNYVQYGYILSELGLDSASTEMTFPFVNYVIGFPIMIMYILSLGVPLLFGLMIDVLQAFNPFALLAPGVNATSLANSELKLNVGNENNFATLKNTLGQWYSDFYNFSWEIVIPISFLVLVTSIMLMRQFWNKGGASKIKKYLIRVVFLMIGIPLCGGCYTAALDSLGNLTSVDNGQATRVVASTFVDFESWVRNGRLAVPEGACIQIDMGKSEGSVHGPTSNSMYSTRANAFYINKTFSYYYLTGEPPFAGATDITETASWNESIIESSGSVSESTTSGSSNRKGLLGWLDNVKEEINDNNSQSKENTTIATTIDILKRYMSAEYYYGSDYETEVKSQLTYLAASDEYGPYIRDTFKFSSKLDYFYASLSSEYGADSAEIPREIGRHRFRDMSDFYGDYVEELGSSALKDRTKLSGFMPNIFANGGLVLDDKSNKYVNRTDNTNKSSSNAGKTTTFTNDTLYGLTTEQGLSTVSMFNYLNTSFESASLTVFSSEKASSGFVRKGHNSVSLVGTGLTSFMYWLNTLILLGLFTVIGYFYGFSIIFGNLKRSLRLICAVPGALLGSIRSIARIITYTVIMILEILVTMFAYFLVTELLMDITGIIETPFIEALDSISSGTLFGLSVNLNIVGMTPILIILSLVISFIVYILTVILALRLRKKLVRSLDEMAANWIDKFMDTRSGAIPSGSKLPGLISKAGGAVATGAGMAMGNKLMNGAMDNLKNAASSNPTSTKSSGSGSSSGSAGAQGQGTGPVQGGIALTGSVDDMSNALPNNNNGLPDSSGDSTVINGGPDGGADGTGDGVKLLGVAGSNNAPQGGDSEGAGFNHADQSSDDKDRAIANQLSGSDTLAGLGDKKDAAVSKADRKLDSKADEMSGKTSAMESEHNDDRKKEIKKAERKEAAKDAATGGLKTAKGAAEAYVGAHTGDAQMVANGVKDVKAGTDQTSKAANKAATAGNKAEAQVEAEQSAKNQQKDTASKNVSANGQNEQTSKTTGESGKHKSAESSQSNGGNASGNRSAQGSSVQAGNKSGQQSNHSASSGRNSESGSGNSGSGSLLQCQGGGSGSATIDNSTKTAVSNSGNNAKPSQPAQNRQSNSQQTVQNKPLVNKNDNSHIWLADNSTHSANPNAFESGNSGLSAGNSASGESNLKSVQATDTATAGRTSSDNQSGKQSSAADTLRKAVKAKSLADKSPK